MGDAYPELKEKQTQIMEALRAEESRFGETLEKGMGLFNQVLNGMKFLKLESLLPQDGVGKPLTLKTADGVEFTAASRVAPGKKQIVIRPRVSGSLNEGMYIDLQAALETAHIPDAEKPFAEALNTYLMDNIANSKLVIGGEHIFKLYDTYGFPYDLTADMARELGIDLDEAGFEREMEAQRARARAAQSFKANAQLPYEGQDTEFKGYSERQTESKVLALYKDGEQVNELNEGDEGAVVIDFTPFYAESGGQVGDVGYIFAGENRFEVRDTQKIKAAVFGQFGVQTSGRLKVGDSVTAKVDDEIRNANMRNHSATHLMHKALRDVLGEHVEQKGSLVTAESTRFDISHPQAVTAEEIAEVERRVNEAILANVAVNAAIMSMEDAQKTGAMMLFGEKYGDEVRVLQMGGFSTELCGGTHVSRTGDIGLFKIISEGGIAAGVRRIEAITGLNALKWAQEQEHLVKDIIAETKAQTEKDVLAKIQAGAAHAKALEKELARAKAELAVHAGAKLLDDAKDLGSAKLVAAQIEADAAALREIVTDLTGKSEQAIVLLAAVNDGKVSLCAGVSKPLTGKVKAGDLVKFAAEQVGGKGGGRPDLAQAGGSDAEKLPAMIESVKDWVGAKLA
ncbi:alanine--tRNA ligase [Neisseria subflava NJ9703]|uniref:Alanine--tRNA ligase n=2 Tax=Neisseria subflava TaxID=28449 RepID=A0A9W5IR38_NEISU|nr:alanine--tRNA ligase [Neisseria subflava NJ9703]